jgi:hypothetical protein
MQKIIVLMMEAARTSETSVDIRTSETSVDIQLRTWQYIPEDSELQGTEHSPRFGNRLFRA